RQADVDRWANPGVEQVGLQIDLTVGDGDDVGGNVRRDIAGLRLDYGQRGQRAPAFLVVQLRRAFQEAGMEIENVAWVCFAAGRAAEQQGDFAICLGVFRQVIVDTERVLLVVQKVFTHGAAAVWRQILKRS